jgi:hypothetical protein
MAVARAWYVVAWSRAVRGNHRLHRAHGASPATLRPGQAGIDLLGPSRRLGPGVVGHDVNPGRGALARRPIGRIGQPNDRSSETFDVLHNQSDLLVPQDLGRTREGYRRPRRRHVVHELLRYAGAVHARQHRDRRAGEPRRELVEVVLHDLDHIHDPEFARDAQSRLGRRAHRQAEPQSGVRAQGERERLEQHLHALVRRQRAAVAEAARTAAPGCEFNESLSGDDADPRRIQAIFLDQSIADIGVDGADVVWSIGNYRSRAPPRRCRSGRMGPGKSAGSSDASMV